jgi:hypothetical protein
VGASVRPRSSARAAASPKDARSCGFPKMVSNPVGATKRVSAVADALSVTRDQHAAAPERTMLKRNARNRTSMHRLIEGRRESRGGRSSDRPCARMAEGGAGEEAAGVTKKST